MHLSERKDALKNSRDQYRKVVQHMFNHSIQNAYEEMIMATTQILRSARGEVLQWLDMSRFEKEEDVREINNEVLK